MSMQTCPIVHSLASSWLVSGSAVLHSATEIVMRWKSKSVSGSAVLFSAIENSNEVEEQIFNVLLSMQANKEKGRAN